MTLSQLNCLPCLLMDPQYHHRFIPYHVLQNFTTKLTFSDSSSPPSLIFKTPNLQSNPLHNIKHQHLTPSLSKFIHCQHHPTPTQTPKSNTVQPPSPRNPNQSHSQTRPCKQNLNQSSGQNPTGNSNRPKQSPVSKIFHLSETQIFYPNWNQKPKPRFSTHD